MELSNIFSFIKKILPSFSRGDLESDLELSISYLKDISIDTYSRLESILGVAKITAPKAKKLTDEFYKNLFLKDSKIRLSPNKNFGTDVNLFLKNIKINGEWLLSELNKHLSDTVITSNLSAKKAFFLRAVGHYSFMGKFSSDLANYIYIFETLEVNKDLDDSYKLTKIQEKNIENNIWIFARLLSAYGQPLDKFKDNISNISEITIPKEADAASGLYESANVDFINNISSGFIGSPIYQIRLIFAQWEAERYKELKDKKKLLELRFLHYKLLKERGETDVNMEKELSYLQKRITDVDYKLSKMDEEVNG